MAWNDDLEGSGLAFAGSRANRVRCLAGPGTGKTYSLMKRVQRLIEEEDIDPRRILVLTLTRTAADDLRRKLENLQVPGANRVYTSTLHSFCFTTLLQEEVLRITNRTPRLLANFERDILLKDLSDDLGTFTQKRKLLTQFEAAWSSLVGTPINTPPGTNPEIFQRELIESLIYHRCMLVSELVPIAHTYFQENPYSSSLDKFDHILVDEYQDLNRADHGVIECLASTATRRNGHISIIGDDDQCIYVGLRHAHPQGIIDFEADDDIPMTECRRCPKLIISMAQHLIEHNPGRIKPPLSPRENNPDGVVHNIIFPTMEEESEGIAQFVHSRLTSGDVLPGEILILANWRVIAYSIRDRLLGLGHEAHSYFREEIIDSNTSKRVLSLLTYISDPNDLVSLRSLLAINHRNDNRTAYRRIIANAKQRDIGIMDILNELIEGTLNIAHTEPAIIAWQQIQNDISQLSEHVDDIPFLIDHLCPENDPETISLRNAMLRIIQAPDFNHNLIDFIDILRSQIGAPDVPLDAPFIRLMSLHKSKGLTVKLVIIAGLVEGLVPRTPKDGLTDLERQELEQEQRRMLFVGITRPTHELILSKFQSINTRSARISGAATGRYVNRGIQTTLTSSLLRELGPNLPPVVRSEDWIY